MWAQEKPPTPLPASAPSCTPPCLTAPSPSTRRNSTSVRLHRYPLMLQSFHLLSRKYRSSQTHILLGCHYISPCFAAWSNEQPSPSVRALATLYNHARASQSSNAISICSTPDLAKIEAAKTFVSSTTACTILAHTRQRQLRFTHK